MQCTVWMTGICTLYMYVGLRAVIVQNLSLIDSTGKITNGLFFIGTKQEQF